jgi:GNAT superfamily N-acetyltransferase
MHVKVRRAEERDGEQIVRLYLQLKKHHAELAPGMQRYESEDDVWRDHALAELRRGDRWFYIALSSDDVLGFVKFVFEERLWGVSCEVETLVVDESARGAGVGAKLMSRAEEVAREQGALGMRVNVLPGNRDGRGFYERDGYRPLAIRYGKAL